MVIAILGIIVLIVGIVLKRSPEPGSHYSNIVRIAGIVIVIIGLLASSIKQIDPGEVGVQVLFGKVQNDVLESGLHFINPAVNVTTYDTRTQNYTMSAKSSEGQVQVMMRSVCYRPMGWK